MPDRAMATLGAFLGVMFLLPQLTAAQPFTFTIVRNDIETFVGPDVDLGDFDDDRDMDILIGGQTTGEFPLAVSRVYVSQVEALRTPTGGGLPQWNRDFMEFGRGFIPGWLGSTRWVDSNRDGRLDAVVLGSNDPNSIDPVAGVYQTVGSQWLEIPSELEGVVGASIDSGDFNRDGRSDLLVLGSSVSGHSTRLYLGREEGGYDLSGVALPQVGLGAASLIDYDSDGDLDIFLAGDAGNRLVVHLLENANGDLVEVPTTFEPVAFASADWGDYDADGDFDLILSGARLSALLMEPVTKIYRNEGNGSFSDIQADLEGSYYGSVRWGDLDDDGDLDAMEVGGGLVDSLSTGVVYRNDAGTFTFATNLRGMAVASATLADYESDGDLDIFQAGEGRPVLWRNEVVPVTGATDISTGDSIAITPDEPASRPLPPSDLVAEPEPGQVRLSWGEGSDEVTPSRALTYNIRVGTFSGSVDIVAPLARLDTGVRKVSRMGNVQNNRSWTLSGLPAGQYFWSVQTIDAAFNGSEWAPEGSFTID